MQSRTLETNMANMKRATLYRVILSLIISLKDLKGKVRVNKSWSKTSNKCNDNSLLIPLNP